LLQGLRHSGRIPDELNRELVVAIARAYAAWLEPKSVAVGYDIRLTSPISRRPSQRA
jgi:phosphomannomutase